MESPGVPFLDTVGKFRLFVPGQGFEFADFIHVVSQGVGDFPAQIS
jgi:hypothetical protein